MRFSDIVSAFKNAGIGNPVWESALLCEHFCGADRGSLLSGMADASTDYALDEAVNERIAGRPLQYILGEWEFFGLPFKVCEGCLIPRSDTEILVEKAISLIPKGVRIADICSGSGCIAVSVLKKRPDLTAVAVDLYDVPLSLTAKNAEQNGVADRLDVVRCDVLGDADVLMRVISDCDVILSNPPYIRTDVIPTLGELLTHEPVTALDGGNDGMLFYRRILEARGKCDVIFEIGYDQGEEIALLAKEHNAECTVYKDYSSNDRVAYIK